MPHEAERAIDTITIGVRHRKDFGDLDELAGSIESIGLLQPITITPDGILVCGRRRLEAVRRLGHRTIKVWIRSGISNRLTELLAQQDENALHKPLTTLEQADLYAELKRLYAEDAQRRKEATQFGAGGVSGDAPLGEVTGSGDSPEPSYGERESRSQAAQTVTGKNSYHRLDHVEFLKMVAADPFQHSTVRDLATTELAAIDAAAPVEPSYRKVRAAIELAARPRHEDDTLTRLGAEAVARAKERRATRRSGSAGDPEPIDETPTLEEPPKLHTTRAFVLTWNELAGWTHHYDLDQLARELSDDELARFTAVVEESVAFLDRLSTARRKVTHAPSASPTPSPCSRARPRVHPA